MTRHIPKHATELKETVRALLAPGKGIVALDESTGTSNRRFKAVGLESNEETRRQYRQLLITAPDTEKYLSGAILFDETIRQADDSGTRFVDILRKRGQIPGIKVDKGANPLAGSPEEKVTEGLDGLRKRIAEYYAMSARFAKWRAVIIIGKGLPTRACYEANAHALARYAALCQEGGLAPIVEPEVLLTGDHSIERCAEVTEENLRNVFHELYHQNVMLEGAILKTSMVLSGEDGPARACIEEVADRTVAVLKRCVPAALGGVVFLSGGQTEEEATAHLNVMNEKYADKVPWRLTFSYARALQQPALDLWGRDQSKVKEAKQAFSLRARLNSLASEGQYTSKLEKAS
jgi:fructose-bisphosphate aldolase class I